MFNFFPLPVYLGKAINIAQKKRFKIGILQASPEGQLVYKKLGFEDICKLYHFEYKI